jgi:hypothetical protein
MTLNSIVLTQPYIDIPNFFLTYLGTRFLPQHWRQPLLPPLLLRLPPLLLKGEKSTPSVKEAYQVNAECQDLSLQVVLVLHRSLLLLLRLGGVVEVALRLGVGERDEGVWVEEARARTMKMANVCDVNVVAA